MDKGKPRGSTGRVALTLVAIVLGIGIGSVVIAPDKQADTSRETRRDEGCGNMGPTCDATPKADGLYNVDSGGFLEPGITPGWIATEGPRAGSRICSWARLSGPAMRLEWVIEGGAVKPGESPAYVHIRESDNSFFSTGCQPWVRIDRKG